MLLKELSTDGFTEPQLVSVAVYEISSDILLPHHLTEICFSCPGHLPVHPYSTDPICLAWNFDKLLAIIRSHGSVVCFMAGHDHDGGYHCDNETGVHHVTFEGVIETPPDSNAFGTVSVYEDRMVLKGSGRIKDRVIQFRGCQRDADDRAK